MERIKYILSFFLFGFIIACLNESCKITHVAEAKPIIKVEYQPLLINNYIHDTIKVKRKTDIDMQSLLKYNFDTYYAKHFTDLKTIIGTLSKSNDNLISTVNDMRRRGVMRQQKVDSLQYVNAILIERLARIETKIDTNEAKDEQFRKTAISSETWDKSLTNLEIYGILAFIVITALNHFVTGYRLKKAFKRANKTI